MSDKKKEIIKAWILIIMIVCLIGAFILFFLGQYKIALGLGGVFTALATFISQWTHDKNADYIYRNSQKNNHHKW